MVAKSLDSEPSCLDSNPRAAFFLALNIWEMLLTFPGLNFLIREQVSPPHRVLRIKCTDICKELKRHLACTKSSINISMI